MPHGAVPFPFGDCRVCADKATGVHYGVATCEGCKGFFKRSIPKAERYKCFFGGSCILSPQNRNRCKACRYQRCMQVGMSTEAVKMGRIPKVDKERALQVYQDRGGSPPPQPSYTNEPLQDANSSQSAGSYPTNTDPMDPLSKIEHMNSDYLHWQEHMGGDLGRGLGDGLDEDLVDDLDDVLGGACNEKNLPDDDEYWKPGNQPDERHHLQQPRRPQQPHQPQLSHHLQQQVRPQLQHHLQQLQQHHRPQLVHQQHHRPQLVHQQQWPRQPQHHSHVPHRHQQPQGLHPSTRPQWSQLSRPDAEHAQQSHDHHQQYPSSDHPHPAVMKNSRSYAQPVSLVPSAERRTNMVDIPMDTAPYGTHQHGDMTPLWDDIQPMPRHQQYPGFHAQENITDQKHTAGSVLGSGEATHAGRQHSVSDDMCESDESRSDTSRQSQTPFSQTIIKELITQVIETGHGPDLEKSLKNQLINTNSDRINYQKVQGNILSIMNEIRDKVKKEPSESDDEYDSMNPAPHPHLKRSISEYDEFMGENVNKVFRGPCVDGQVQRREGTDGLQYNRHRNEEGLNRVDECGNGSRPAWAQDFISERLHTIGSQPIGEQISAGVLTDQLIQDVLDDNVVTNSDTLTSECSSHQRTEVAEPSCSIDGSNHGSDHVSSSVAANVTSSEEFNPVDNQVTSPMSEDSIDNTHIADLLDTFDQVLNVQQAEIRKSEHFMKLQLAGKLPIHPLNEVKYATKACVKYIWDLLMSAIPMSNQIIIGFCQSLPEFSTICKEDQSILLQEAYFPIWLTSHVKLFHKGETYLRMHNNALYSRWWMNHILPVDLINSMHKFTDELNSYQLTGAERILLCAIQLFNPEREGLKSVERVQQIYDRLLDVLAYLIAESHKSNHGRILMRILRLLPTLEPINKQQKQVIGSFSIDSPPEGQLKYCKGSDEENEEEWRVEMDLSMYEDMNPD